MNPPENRSQPPNDHARGNREQAVAQPDGTAHGVLAVCGLLLLAVGLVFGQTLRHDFVNLDDSVIVYLNPHVAGGLTAEGVKRAFTRRYVELYTPVTVITHLLDCQFYGLNAGGHHLTNVLLHAATAVLLFLVLRQMTGRLWPSALVAGVFAVHPLRVESVAWIAERKDVLSGLFFVLALGAYVRYVRRPFSVLRYLTVMGLFLLGLMAKPMLVTLPFVLLLLDYWPLGRFAAASTADGGPGWNGNPTTASQPAPPQATQPRLRWSRRAATRLVLEKVPLLALAIVFCAVAIWSCSSDGVDVLDRRFALSWRVENAPISYCWYLGTFFYPAGLAAQYPGPGFDLPLWKVSWALVILVVITSAALIGRRRCPYLLVGWLWCLGMLIPVSEFLHFGMQTVADRYTYLPQIGLCLALTWGLADVLRSLPVRRWACGVAAALALVVLMGCAWRQTSFWRNSDSLWTRTLACTSRNGQAHHGLGNLFLDRGQIDKAIEQYQAAIAIEPDNAMAHYNLGVALASMGRLDEAIEQYRKTVQLQPNDAAAQNNLGQALLIRGQIEKGMTHCQEALRIDPQFAEAHYNVGNVLYFRGRMDEAIAEYQAAVRTKPELAPAHYHLGLALARRGRFDDAIVEYRKALETKSDFAAEVHNALGLALAARGRPDEAIIHYRKALAISPDFIDARYNLGRALAGKRS
jgi:protein O-mannosyl-transferase